MNAVKVYKIEIRKNVLRQIIFTNINLFLGLIAICVFSVWQIMAYSVIELRIFVSLCVSGALMLIFTSRIDRQSLLQLFRRLPAFIIREKQIRN
jgi:hypothetical protein